MSIPLSQAPYFASAGDATRAANNRHDEKGSADHDGSRLQPEAQRYDEAGQRRRRRRPLGESVKSAFARGVKPGALTNSG